MKYDVFEHEVRKIAIIGRSVRVSKLPHPLPCKSNSVIMLQARLVVYLPLFILYVISSDCSATTTNFESLLIERHTL